MNTLQILEAIANTSSRTNKENLLKVHDSDLLRSVLLHAYDPFRNYYIKQIPNYTPDPESCMGLDDALLKLFNLSSRKVTGREAQDFLASILASLKPDDATVLKRIIKKDLRCGISAKTINKVYGKGFIKEYPCILASKQDEKTMANIQFPAICQMKYDGMRVNAVSEYGKVSYFSRSGKPLLINNPDLDFQVAQIEEWADHPIVLDGELLSMRGDVVVDRKTSNGICNKGLHGTISEDEIATLNIVAWDLIPLRDFKKSKCEIPYEERFVKLQVVLEAKKPSRIHPADSHVVDSWGVATTISDRYIAMGHEGAIVKNSDSPWENKRSKHLVKLKAVLEADLIVVGFVEGTGKYEGMLGALELESGCGKLAVKVGSGFNDKQRTNLWFQQDRIIGRIAAIKYNAIIDDKSRDTKSLFLPIFVELRDDKDVADSLEDLE